jgi:NAD/NADP transhydrogenase beta subunit
MNRRERPKWHCLSIDELFYMDKTMMVFGDAKKVIEDMVKAVE